MHRSGNYPRDDEKLQRLESELVTTLDLKNIEYERVSREDLLLSDSSFTDDIE